MYLVDATKPAVVIPFPIAVATNVAELIEVYGVGKPCVAGVVDGFPKFTRDENVRSTAAID
jgi:hypothetical protein